MKLTTMYHFIANWTDKTEQTGNIGCKWSIKQLGLTNIARKNVKLDIFLSTSLKGIYPRSIKTQIHKKITFKTNLVKIFQTEDKCKCSSIGESITKPWHTHSMEYFPSHKNKWYIDIKIWMSPQNMLRKIRQKQKIAGCMIPFK